MCSCNFYALVGVGGLTLIIIKSLSNSVFKFSVLISNLVQIVQTFQLQSNQTLLQKYDMLIYFIESPA